MSAVCPPVCPVPGHNSRTERSRKRKVGNVEAHHTSDIYRTEKATNFKLGTQTEDEDPHNCQAP